MRNGGGGFAEILRLSSHISDKPFFNIRRFSPLRMTKCAVLLPLNLEPRTLNQMKAK